MSLGIARIGGPAIALTDAVLEGGASSSAAGSNAREFGRLHGLAEQLGQHEPTSRRIGVIRICSWRGKILCSAAMSAGHPKLFDCLRGLNL
jgi:hypothetical protein